MHDQRSRSKKTKKTTWYTDLRRKDHGTLCWGGGGQNHQLGVREAEGANVANVDKRFYSDFHKKESVR